MYTVNTIDMLSTIFSSATKKVLEMSTQRTITISPTFQKIPKVSLRPDVGAFVPFAGDYGGLVVVNFSGKAAMQIYRTYMIRMGIPEKELVSDFTSGEVADTIGEITNQIMGQSMSLVEEKFQLSSFCSQPKALALTSAITLTIDSDYTDNRRISFGIDGFKFYMELAMEATEFIRLK